MSPNNMLGCSLMERDSPLELKRSPINVTKQVRNVGSFKVAMWKFKTQPTAGATIIDKEFKP